MSTVVIMPGGFHPFHAGHAALYQSAVKAFPDADVYVAATNDTSDRPFPFSIKEKLARVAGVPPGRFVQVKSPFSSEEITNKYDPNNTVLIFVKSQKNAKTGPDPEGPFPAEVDPATGKLPLVTRGARKGQPVSTRLQYYKGNEDKLQPMSRHSYLAYLPTVEFGPGIKSGSELRNIWPKLDDRRKTAFVMSMYPATQKNLKLAQVVVKLLDAGMGGQQGVAEGEVIPFARKPQPKLTWQQVPKDVLLLANDWFWADEDDTGLDAVLDPKGYGNGTSNDVQYIAAKLQQKGWAIEHDLEDNRPGEFNMKLTNKLGQSVLLPWEDAQDFKGWAAGTRPSMREGDENQYRRPSTGEAAKVSQQTRAKINPVRSQFVWKKPNQIGGSFSEQDLLAQGFKKSQYNSWGGTQQMWDRLSGIKEGDMAEARVLFTNPNTKVNVYYNSRNPKYAGKPVQVAKEIPYGKIDRFIDMVVAKYQIKPTELMWTDSTRDKVDAHIVHENSDYLEEK